ncbi:MAG TPA: pantetheine-phosphate adenylyltransferase [Clostridiales bacterium]|nr:pantetheine-phosphate adenylyltransferase [Clostridia bacterium]MDD4679542.1 pantetheine-phosphate adenylyltransferase [Clostridia bacterium]HCS72521.1 pantetheine-phosphate adenylyltransferase [Clostridiales bacterium]
MRIAVYPGSFDPITYGHLDIIQRSSKVFDKVIVAVVKNRSKEPLFSVEERMNFIRRSITDLSNVEVDHFDGLLVNFVTAKKAQVIVKGLRAMSDFEYEFQMALLNRKLQPKVETMFLMTDHKYSYLSSSMVKEIAGLGGSIRDLVPEAVILGILSKFKK